jgi:hypothetical protein
MSTPGRRFGRTWAWQSLKLEIGLSARRPQLILNATAPKTGIVLPSAVRTDLTAAGGAKDLLECLLAKGGTHRLIFADTKV